MSMTVEERKRLAVAWKEASNGRLELVVHVGANCLKDCEELVLYYLLNLLPDMPISGSSNSAANEDMMSTI